LIQRGAADVLLALEADEAVRNLPFLRRGGLAFVDAENGLRPEVTERLEQFNLQVFSLPASQMAVALGAPAVANVILAGFAAAHPALALPFETLRQTLETLAPRGQALNLQALEAGHNYFRF
jgi:Pyruvate/2-oxoacid:ferredoxin oxidoreductase gamma subunit